MDLGIRGLGPGVRIGLGASAVVYRARQEQLGRDVAVKLLTERDPSFVRRFEREALALGQLSRLPGIVTVHDTGLTELGEPYLVLEYCPSSLLDRLHREGPLAPAEAARLLARVAATVAQAHEVGIVHRDLKPANILLTASGEPLVADLGMASVLGAGLTTSIGFTPGYAAPENLRGEAGGPDVDVYALGASLFQLVSGRVPFADPTGLNNLVALAVAIEQQPVEDLRPQGVPDRLCQVVESAMAKQPAQRPSVAALADWLTTAAAELSPGSSPAAAAPAAPPAPGTPGRVRPVRPAVNGPAPATFDGPADEGHALVPAGMPAPVAAPPAGVPFPAPPAPAGAPVSDRPALADLAPPAPAPWSSPGPTPGPVPHRADVVAERAWAPGSSPRLSRRHPDRRAGSRSARRWSTVTVFGGAAATGLAVAFFASLLPGTETSGGSGNFGATTTTATAFFTATTPFPDGGAVATTWGPSVDDVTTSMAAYEVQWDKARTDALSVLAAPGVLDGVRPAVASCPDAWSDTAGIGGADIALDLLIPDRTDPTSEAGRLAQGLVTYFDWVNANGGVGADHRQITARLVDDRDGAGAEPGGAPFAVAALDPGVHAGSVDDLTAGCIPEPLAVTPHPSAGDAATYPWTTGGPELSLSSEARLWAELIGRQSGDTSRSPSIIALAGQDETGALYRQAFDQAMADRAGTVTYITSPDELTAPPDVLIVMAAPEECRAMLPTLAEQLAGGPLHIAPAACASPSTGSTLPSTGGWLSLPGGIRDATSYYYDDAFQRLIDAQLRSAGLDETDPLIRKGFGLYGWLWQQILEIAAALPNGLTRTNLVAAQRHLTGLTHPMLMTGITLATGPDDPWLVEGSAFTSDSGGGTWVIDGVIDANGSTPRCRWEGLTHRCGPA